MAQVQRTQATRLRELAAVFFKLGLTAFGGPAAHIAMMEDEVVTRRQWVTRERFVDLLGATNLIPGPNSTEMGIHIGYVRAGVPGLLVAGISFVLPASLITLVFAWAYVKFSAVPQANALLFGLKPAVIAIILAAVWKLGKAAAKKRALMVLGVAVMALVLAGLNPVAALLGGGMVGIVWHIGKNTVAGKPAPTLLFGAPLFSFPVAAAVTQPASLLAIGLFFLKIGGVLFGSGYVLVAFLQGDLVERYHWLTQQQLLDAIAIGQFTPGPVLSTATFIGYVLKATPGAAVATVSIFAPSFLFVLLTNPLIPRLRQSAVAAAFLDSVNVSAIALMAAVTVQLARNALTDWSAWAIAAASSLVLLRYPKLNAAWLVLGGAVVGYLLKTFAMR